MFVYNTARLKAAIYQEWIERVWGLLNTMVLSVIGFSVRGNINFVCGNRMVWLGRVKIRADAMDVLNLPIKRKRKTRLKQSYLRC